MLFAAAVSQKIKIRLFFAGLFLGAAVIAGFLVIGALRKNLIYFYTPTELAAALQKNPSLSQKRLRIGGMVLEGSVRKKGRRLTFLLGDSRSRLVVRFEGMPPDLFRSGAGAVAEGYLNVSRDAVHNLLVLNAQTLLAKHDENYRPPQGMPTGFESTSNP